MECVSGGHQFLCPKEIQHFSESEQKVLFYTIHYSSFAALAATSCVKKIVTQF